MSPNDHSTSQPAPERSTSNTQKDNVALALRPLAPKAASRFRPLAIRGSSESLFTSSQGQAQYSSQARARTSLRCSVCYKRNCPLASHKFHDEARRLRRSQALSASRTTIHRDNSSDSYAVEFAALYESSNPSADELGVLSQLPIPDGLNRPLMHQLFHICKMPRQSLPQREYLTCTDACYQGLYWRHPNTSPFRSRCRTEAISSIVHFSLQRSPTQSCA